MRLDWSLPVEKLSATSMALAINCPEAWRRRHILKQKDTLTGARFLGLVAHGAREANFRQKIESGKDLPLDDVKLAYVQQWEETIEQEGEPDWRDADPTKMYTSGLNSVELYHTQIAPKIQPLGVEEKIEFTVPDIPIPIIGYVDVRTKDRVIDLKTSKNRLSKPKSAWRLQARVYSYATGLPVDFQILTKQVTPQIVTSDECPDLLIQPANKKHTERFIGQVARRINDDFARYGAENPWPTLGQNHDWLCGFCSAGFNYRNDCVAWKEQGATAAAA